jgi:hypothetical protein
MSNEIKIIIGGDPSGFTKAAKEVTVSTDRMRNSLKDAASATPAFNNALSSTTNALKSGVTPAAKSASNALLGLNRIVQDAPFGFASIGNNITELPGAFQSLSAAAKESGQSIKSLLISSLLGPAGIGVALSLVTSALTFATVGFDAWTRGFGKSKEEVDKHKKELDEFIKSLRSVSEVTNEAAASQQGQIAEVQALAKVVHDANNAYDQRKNALEQLQKINKSYFGDLTLEEAQTDKLTKRVNEYTKALVAQAVVKGFTDEIARVSVELAKQERVLNGNANEVNRLRAALDNTKKSETSLTGEDRISQKYVRVKDALDDANDAFSAQYKVVSTLRTNYDDLNSEIENAVNNTTKLKGLANPGKDKAEVDFLKKRLEALEKIQQATKDATTRVGLQEAIFELQVKITLRDAAKNNLSKAEIDNAIQGFQAELQKEFLNQAIELEAIPKVRFSPTVRLDTSEIANKVFTSKDKIILAMGENGVEIRVSKESVDVTDLQGKIAKATGLDKAIKIATQFDIDLTLFGKKFAENAKLVRDQIAAVSKTLFDGIMSGIQEGTAVLATAFADIFSGEGVTNSLAKAAQGLLGIVGGILQEVGKQIIVTSALVKTLKTAISKLFGPGGEAIAAAVGVALIATGAVLKNIKFNVPQLAEGGIATRATLGIFGEAGREAIIPLNKLPEMVGKLSTDNAQPIIINGNMRVDGTDLQLMLERVTSRRSRLG